MRYVAWDDLGGRPNVIVDGYGTDGTVLTLSHWPGAGTPEVLADDLSTQIAFRYLDHAELRVDAELASNNHFDEDGLCGIFAVTRPEAALAHRARIIDIASTGDFGIYRDREAARIAFALMAYADEDRSPMQIFDMPYPAQAAALYEELLGRLPEMLEDPDRYRSLWEDDDARLTRDEERIARGKVVIDELPDLDLAIVRALDGEPVHEVAVNTATRWHRVLELFGTHFALRYRYETWVAFRSRPTVDRVPLEPLAAELTAIDSVRWSAGSVDDITPRLAHDGESALDEEVVLKRAVEHLASFTQG